MKIIMLWNVLGTCHCTWFGPKFVTCISLGTIKKKKTLYFLYNLWRKVVSLFCFVLFVLMKSTGLGCLRLFSWSLWKALDEEGCMGLVPWCLDLRCKSFWILNFFSLKVKLNHSWKLWKNWNVPLVLLKIFWWLGFNVIYLVRFGFKMWKIWIKKWFLLLKIQISSKKLGFGRKNQLRTCNTWGNGTCHNSKYKQGWKSIHKNYKACQSKCKHMREKSKQSKQ